MVAPGTQQFTSFSTGKESTAGTSVATTAEWYGDGTGEIEEDEMLALHRGNRGTRTALAHATSRGQITRVTFNTDPDIGYAYNELHKLFGQMDGGNSGAGASADKTWTIAPAQTADPAAESYTIEIGDDIQFWEVPYAQVSSFSLSGSIDSMLTGTVNWFGRKAAKVSATSLAANQYVRIPAKIFEPKIAAAQADLSGASVLSNFLESFDITYQTGLRPDFSIDGRTDMGQSVPALEMKADCTFVFKSGATAVAEYDKYKARTTTFWQLSTDTNGPTLGDTNYKVELNFALIYTGFRQIASDNEGVNLYEATAETVIDPTWSQSMSAVIVNSLATIT